MAIILYEMRRVRLERAVREEERDERWKANARRVSAWVQPIMFVLEREGIRQTVPSGWELVVYNASDDSLIHWRALALAGDEAVAVVGADDVGAVPAGERRAFDLPRSNMVPDHWETTVDAVRISFTDRHDNVWIREGQSLRLAGRGALKEAEDGSPDESVERLGHYRAMGVERQGISWTRMRVDP